MQFSLCMYFSSSCLLRKAADRQSKEAKFLFLFAFFDSPFCFSECHRNGLTVNDAYARGMRVNGRALSVLFSLFSVLFCTTISGKGSYSFFCKFCLEEKTVVLLYTEKRHCIAILTIFFYLASENRNSNVL